MKDDILVAEDCEADVFLIQRAFKKGGLESGLMVVPNGEEAIKHLKGVGCYSDRTTFRFPNLLLLDLNMPRQDGFEVLSWVKRQTDPRLKDLPMVMLTDSNFVADANRACRLGAHSFFVKSPGLKDAVQLCLSICRYRLAVKTNAKAKMPARVWPPIRTLSPYDPISLEEPCFTSVERMGFCIG